MKEQSEESPVTSASHGEDARAEKSGFRDLAGRLIRTDGASAMLGIIVLFIGLSLLTPYFLTPRNITNLLVQMSVIALLAGGQTFVILTGGIDLSVAAIAALAGASVGHLTARLGLDPLAGVTLGLFIGGAVGLLNGLLVAKAGLPAFIVTLGGFTLWRGLAWQVTGGYDVSGMVDLISFLGRGELLFIPMPIVIMFLYYFIAAAVLKHTRLGRYTYAIGSNEEAARRAGIPIPRYKIAVYIICGLSAGLAAMVLIGRLDSSGGKIASGFELDAIAAVILGGTSLFGGRGVIWGSLLGALLMTMIRNGMNLLGISPFLQMITLGLVIIGAVWLDVIRQRRVNPGR